MPPSREDDDLIATLERALHDVECDRAVLREELEHLDIKARVIRRAIDRLIEPEETP